MALSEGKGTEAGNRHSSGFGPKGLKEQMDARAAKKPEGRSPKLDKGIKHYSPKGNR